MSVSSPSSIGIVVPSLNQGRFLGDALDSLLSQAGVTLRAAVMDGGSSDVSAGIIERYRSRLSVCRIGPDGGQAAAVNDGVRLLVAAHPEIDAVGFLNADDRFEQDGLAHLHGALDAHGDWVAAAGRARVVDERGESVAEYAVGPFDRRAMAHRCTICQPATLVRRAAWDEAGGLDPRFQLSSDYDLWWRLLRLGPIGFVDRVVAASRDHDETKTRSRRRDYFSESIGIVRRETGWVSWHWCVSEALERQAGWRMNANPGTAAKTVAGVRAAAAYLSRNLLRRPD